MKFSIRRGHRIARAAVLVLVPLSLTVAAAGAPKGKAKAKAQPAAAVVKKAQKAPEKKKAPEKQSAEKVAPATNKSIALGAVTGAKSKDVRGWIREVLEANYELTDAEDFKPKGDNASFAKMARDLSVDVVVVGKLEKKRLLLSVRGADGGVIAELEFKSPAGPKLKAAIQKRLAPKLAEKLGDSPAPVAAEEKAEPEDDAAEEEGAEAEAEAEAPAEAQEGEAASAETASESSEATAAAESPAKPFVSSRSAFDLRLGLKVSVRKFSYKDRIQDLLPDRVPTYRLNNYAGGTDLSLVARAEFYPGVLLGAEGLVSNLGLVGGYELGLPSKTEYRPQNMPAKKLDNKASDWHIGVRGRVPFSDATDLGFTGTYGKQKYVLEGDELEPLIPDITYSYLRLGVDVRSQLGKILLEVRAGARLVTDTGQLAVRWFPQAGAIGFDGGANVGYMLTPMLGVIGGLEFMNYGLNFNPIAPNATMVAGGASDRYISGWLGGRLVL